MYLFCVLILPNCPLFACVLNLTFHISRQVRQYKYVQTVPRPPTDIGPLAPGDVAMAFMEFALHVLSQQERGDMVPDDESWSHSRGYMRWFCTVSHPIVNLPTTIPDYTADAHPRPVSPYEEVIVEQQWARHAPDPLQIIHDVKGIVDSAMTVIPDVCVMERIRQQYRMLEQMPAPRRRSRNPRE
jgi:hypothetical protein